MKKRVHYINNSVRQLVVDISRTQKFTVKEFQMLVRSSEMSEAEFKRIKDKLPGSLKDAVFFGELGAFLNLGDFGE